MSTENRPKNPERSPLVVTAAELELRTRAALRAEYDRYVASPAAASLIDPAAALYTRESDPDSMIGDAPVNQIRGALDLMAANGALPPWENVYFENETGTEIAVRDDFQDLVIRAMSGEFKFIGAYLSNRLFRNADESSAVKKQLRRRGVKLVWLGKPMGMDERDPNGWLMEKNADIIDEWHSRQTGWLVGRQLEFKTRKGEPIGKLPEVWVVDDRAPSLRVSRLGRPISWKLSEPMATIVRQGAAKYRGGCSFRDLEAWGKTTELRGITPAKKVMDWIWWNRILKNPKLAGLHVASVYMGYKPGKGEFPSRKEKMVEKTYVACALPPIISVEDWEEIVALSAGRHGAKGLVRTRDDHKREILSGVAFDARCGHKLTMLRHVRNDYWMKCMAPGFGRHHPMFAARAAGEDLELLIANLSFDDSLTAAVVRALEQQQTTGAETARPSQPSAAAQKLQAAIDAMGGLAELAVSRDALITQLRGLETKRTVVGRGARKPANRLAEAVAAISNWRDVWAQSSAAEKNALLRAAGVRIGIEPTGYYKHVSPAKSGRRSRLAWIETDVPEFSLAIALGSPGLVDAVTSGPQRVTASTWTGRVRVLLPPEYVELLQRLSLCKAA